MRFLSTILWCCTLPFLICGQDGTIQPASSCQETFERYVGYRLAYDASKDFVLRNFTLAVGSNSFLGCRDACKDESKCQAFTMDFLQLRCATYGSFFDSEAKFLRTQLENSAESILWRRVCLKASASNCTYSWRFDAVPAYTMRPDQIDRFEHVSSMQECQDACRTHNVFQCRSAVYNYVTRNCHLSKQDRRSLSRAFIRGTVQDIYFENQCATAMTTGCDFTLEESAAPAFALVSITTNNASVCERLCLDHQDFLCRSYTFSSRNNLCIFGPDDTFTIDRYDDRNGSAKAAAHFQRNECTNVEVFCGTDQMIANFRADRAFDGRIVSMRAPKTCSFDVKQQFEFNVSFSLEQKTNCGLQDEESNTVSAMIMMQYHDSVVTAKDRALKVVCKYELTSQTVGNFVELGEGNAATNATVVTGGGPLPEAFMRIVNGEGQTVTTAEIGQTLYAEIILKDGSGKPGAQSDYTLFVNNCEALDDGQSVLLLDDAGCPVDTTLFEGFHPAQGENDNKVLRAAFQGFRFQTKRRVNINCNVNFCYRFCQPALCTDKNGRRIMSWGRKKRSFDIFQPNTNEIFARVYVQSGFDIVDSRKLQILAGDSNGKRFNNISKAKDAISAASSYGRPKEGKQLRENASDMSTVIGLCAAGLIALLAVFVAVGTFCSVRRRWTTRNQLKPSCNSL